MPVIEILEVRANWGVTKHKLFKMRGHARALPHELNCNPNIALGGGMIATTIHRLGQRTTGRET
eukprot:10954097-Lingulodinium_polyedra.AAC.1